MAESWFEQEFNKQTQAYLDGKIDLNTYKCWIYPNSWYLEFEEGHLVHGVKWALAEYSDEILLKQTISGLL